MSLEIHGDIGEGVDGDQLINSQPLSARVNCIRTLGVIQHSPWHVT